jgi:hypothetical protein
MLPKVTEMLNLFAVIMVMLTAVYLAVTFSHVLSTTVKLALVALAAGYGLGYSWIAATVSAQKRST